MISPAAIQVIIPALDEEATIGAVVATLRDLGLTRIRVVDNGSRDTTVPRARAAGAEVIVESRRGYGQACWTGSQNLPPEVEWILFCDADGSDDLRDIARLLAEASAGADFVLGDRRARPEARAVMTPVQNFGNALSTTLIRLGWGQHYRDLGPLRLVRRSLFERIGMRDRGFGWTIEMQVRAVELGARIVELPVGYLRRQGGRSKISGTIKGSVQAGTIILSTLAALAWRQAGPALRTAALLVLGGAALLWPHGAATAASVPWFLAAAAIMGAGYVLTWRPALARAAVAAWLFWGVAVAARLLLLPMEPGDDVWRYLWEGRVQLAGHSPYHSPPLAPELAGLRTDWWSQINHPDKTAIYPPLLQLGFRGLAASLGDFVWLWKLVFIAADLAVCGLLARRFGRAAALLFAWNPLILYVTAGGAHFESLLLLPLVAAWLAWERGGWARAALGVGLSIGIKWITAPLLGWLVWQQRRQPLRALATLALGLLPVGLALLWFRVEFGPLGTLWPGDFVAKARGMDLLPWLVDLVRRPAEVSNAWIPLLFFPLAAAALLLSRRFVTAAESFFVVLLVCLPSIHPWYFAWLMPWAVATGNLGARLLALSGFVYFWVWRTHDLTGLWQTSPAERLLLWLPFVAGWILWRFIHLRTPGPDTVPNS
jgi:hypothetical protein